MVPTPSTTTERDLKNLILAEIWVHMRVYGRERWELICERPEFSHLIGKEAGPSGRRKFFRWVRSVCTASGPDKTRPHEGKEVMAEAMTEATMRARLAATKNIPHPPSPAYMLKAGAGAERKIEFLAEMCVLMEDAHALRAEAFDENGQIKDEKTFSNSIHARLRIIAQGVAVWREVYDLQDQIKFYDLLVDLMVNELADFPVAQERVIRRFEELNASRGMTIHASSPR
jgi:hypothetical protein